MHTIVRAEKSDSEVIAAIISRSNEDVARLLGLTKLNAAKHPSFCTYDWILSDFARGQKYFLLTEGTIQKGCVAFEQPTEDTAYLNRLAVLPEYRNRGLGTALVQHIIDYSKSKNVTKISIGIIAEHTHLRDWYLKHEFIEGELQKFEHLPFDVLYMHYEI